MAYNHFEQARCMFIDGPLALYICEAKPELIKEAYERLGRVVEVAARLIEEERKARGSLWEPQQGKAIPAGVDVAGASEVTVNDIRYSTK